MRFQKAIRQAVLSQGPRWRHGWAQEEAKLTLSIKTASESICVTIKNVMVPYFEVSKKIMIRKGSEKRQLSGRSSVADRAEAIDLALYRTEDYLAM